MPTAAKSFRYLAAALGGAVVIVLALVLWQSRPAADPASLFWDAITADLTSKGITCTIAQTNGTSSSSQAISLDLASKEKLRSVTTLKQPGSSVTTEGLDTGSTAYVRYTAVQAGTATSSGAKPNFGKALNVWSKAAGSSQTTSLFGRTALGNCVVPLADLRPGPAAALVSQLQQGKGFSTDFTKATTGKLSGRPVTIFAVTVQPEPYITFMKQVGAAYGLHTLDGVTAASYAGRTAQKITMSIDTKTARLEKISYVGSAHTITFSDDGKAPTITVPRTTVTPAELQQKLQAN